MSQIVLAAVVAVPKTIRMPAMHIVFRTSVRVAAVSHDLDLIVLCVPTGSILSKETAIHATNVTVTPLMHLYPHAVNAVGEYTPVFVPVMMTCRSTMSCARIVVEAVQTVIPPRKRLLAGSVNRVTFCSTIWRCVY